MSPYFLDKLAQEIYVIGMLCPEPRTVGCVERIRVRSITRPRLFTRENDLYYDPFARLQPSSHRLQYTHDMCK